MANWVHPPVAAHRVSRVRFRRRKFDCDFERVASLLAAVAEKVSRSARLDGARWFLMFNENNGEQTGGDKELGFREESSDDRQCVGGHCEGALGTLQGN